MRRHLQRVREPRAVVVAARRHEHLRLVRQAAERLAVHDPVAVALKRRAQRAVLLARARAAPGRSARPAARAAAPPARRSAPRRRPPPSPARWAMLTARLCHAAAGRLSARSDRPQLGLQRSGLAVPVAASRERCTQWRHFFCSRGPRRTRAPAARLGKAARGGRVDAQVHAVFVQRGDVRRLHEPTPVPGRVDHAGRGRCPSRAPPPRAPTVPTCSPSLESTGTPSRAAGRRSAVPRSTAAHDTARLTQTRAAAGISRRCAWCSSVAAIARSTWPSARSRQPPAPPSATAPAPPS